MKQKNKTKSCPFETLSASAPDAIRLALIRPPVTMQRFSRRLMGHRGFRFARPGGPAGAFIRCNADCSALLAPVDRQGGGGGGVHSVQCGLIHSVWNSSGAGCRAGFGAGLAVLLVNGAGDGHWGGTVSPGALQSPAQHTGRG